MDNAHKATRMHVTLMMDRCRNSANGPNTLRNGGGGRKGTRGDARYRGRCLGLFVLNFLWLLSRERLELPVPIFFGQPSHKRDSALNSSVQIFPRHERFYKTCVCTILQGYFT